MTNCDPENEMLLVAALKLDSHEAFVRIFRHYYPDLIMFASRFIPDMETCEDIVQEAFMKIWSNRKILEIRTSLRTYLISLVQNLALNELKHRKVKMLYQDKHHEMILALSAEEHMFYTELRSAINTLLANLDPAMRETYIMSRVQRLKYAEIAQRLNISVRTVEVRISKAVSYLQRNLSSFKSIILILLSLYK